MSNNAISSSGNIVLNSIIGPEPHLTKLGNLLSDIHIIKLDEFLEQLEINKSIVDSNYSSALMVQIFYDIKDTVENILQRDTVSSKILHRFLMQIICFVGSLPNIEFRKEWNPFLLFCEDYNHLMDKIDDTIHTIRYYEK